MARFRCAITSPPKVHGFRELRDGFVDLAALGQDHTKSVVGVRGKLDIESVL